jgi:hypothetical protein
MLTLPPGGSPRTPDPGAKETMNKLVRAICVIAVVFVGSREASAQTAPWSDRGYVNVGWGVESGSSAMIDSRTATIYEETATINTSSTFSSGSLFDVGVGIRVWRNLTVGAAYHQEQNDTEGSVSGSIPSPTFFNRPRTISGIEALERKEAAGHINIGWVLPFNDKLDVLIYGGPSFFRLTQDVISNAVPNEAGATATTITATITTTERAKSVTGFNVGADATYILWSNDSIRMGAGGFVRFAQASTDVEMLSTSQPTDVGGMQFGFGARLRF